MKTDQLSGKIAEALKAGSPVVTAAEIRNGCVQKIQLYFDSGNQAVMDVITKDDLVQNFPDEGVYVLSPGEKGCTLKKLTMFEGDEDMFFRTDGTKTQADEFGGVPCVEFLEAVEALSTLKW